MPSPLGHALAGAAVGLAVAGPIGGGVPAPARAFAAPHRTLLTHSLWRQVCWFAFLGALPDVDFVFGTHSTYTHSVGAMLLVLAVAWLVTRQGRLALAASLAYGSHILLDWMGNDSTPPIGVMALWPFSDGYYESNVHIFMAISRRYWLDNFWTHNVTAVALEALIVGPFTLLAVWWRKRQG